MPENPEADDSVQHVNVMGEETQNWLQCDIINTICCSDKYLTVSWYKNNVKNADRIFQWHNKNTSKWVLYWVNLRREKFSWDGMWYVKLSWTLAHTDQNVTFFLKHTEFQQTASKHPGCLQKERYLIKIVNID